MDVIFEYFKTVLCVYIIVSFLGKLCLSESHNRQITMICSVAIILAVLGIIFKAGDVDVSGKLLGGYMGDYDSDRRLYSLILKTEDANCDMYVSYYEEEVKKYINSLLVQSDYRVKEAEVYINFDENNPGYGSIEKMNIELEDISENALNNEGIKDYTIVELKNNLANFYNLAMWNININMEEQIEQ